MNKEVKKINVNDFEVVKKPKTNPTLWEQLSPEHRKKLTYESETYDTCLVLVTKLKTMHGYFNLTWGDIMDIHLYADIQKITTPEKIFNYVNN